VLKVPQGDRRHFKKKDITPVMVSEDKFLQVPLMMAERAWSYAMQLRQESNTELRKKFHLISRLKKAATYSLQLQDLIEVRLSLIKHFFMNRILIVQIYQLIYELLFFILCIYYPFIKKIIFRLETSPILLSHFLSRA